MPDPKPPQLIEIENLKLSLDNPRFEPVGSERMALNAIITDQGAKLLNLAEDISFNGISPADLPIVTPSRTNKKIYDVLEGNRRIAALKLLRSPTLASSLKFKKPDVDKLARFARTGTVPDRVLCAVMEREQADHWIRLRHTGENDGRGVIRWTSMSTARFRQTSLAFQAISLADDAKAIDAKTKQILADIPITTLDRILTTPEARDLIGVTVSNRKLELLHPEQASAEKLALVISDVAHRTITVPGIENRDDRINYARSVSVRHAALSPETTTTGTQPSTPTPKPVRKPPVKPRTTLIPKNFNPGITQNRIAAIHVELQKLSLANYTNSCSILFRVYIEMSVDEFADRNSISLVINKSNRAMNLRKKISTVSEYLSRNKLANKNDLQGIGIATGSKGTLFSVDTWNAYVHNRKTAPVARDLRDLWDSVQSFVEKLWS